MPTPVGESDPEDMTPEVELELAPVPPALALALGLVPDPEALAADLLREGPLESCGFRLAKSFFFLSISSRSLAISS